MRKSILSLQEFPDRCHESHKTRDSDASSFDLVCDECGATDISGGGWGNLRYPCDWVKENDQSRHKNV